MTPVITTCHPAVETEVIHRLEPLRAPWRALAEARDNVFSTWEWASTWWRHYGRGRELHVISMRRDGQVIGLLPLYEWRRRPLRILRIVGHGTSDELGVICASGDRAEALDAVRRAIDGLPWQLLLAEHLPVAGRWDAALQGTPLRSEASPVARFGDGGWEGYLAARSRNVRSQIRRRRRLLAHGHDVSYRLITEEHELPAAMSALFRLHHLRWPKGSDFLRAEAFHREIAATALRHGWLRLWLLHVDGQAAAASYGFRFGAGECCYQSGRDPAYDHRSLGFLLMAHAIEQAARDGMAEFRMLRGREPHKYRFATEDWGVVTVAVARNRGLSSALPVVAAAGSNDGRLAAAARGLAARYLG